MKALRGLKKRKPLPIDDPQKIAQQKLAILSDQAFIYTAEDHSASQSWTISSFNAAPRPSHELNVQDQSETKTMKFKEKTSVNVHNKNRPSLSEELMNQSRLKRYFRVSEEERMKKNLSEYFPQRKSLSLTNYILFDKRKPSESLNDKKLPSNNQFQRLKLLQLKKMIISRRNKRNSSQQRVNQSQSHNPSPPSHTKIYFSRNYKEKNNRAMIQEEELILPKRREERKASEAETILESIVKRKDVPNMNVKKYNKQYELIRERVEKSRQIESSINSTKLKLHDYYQSKVKNYQVKCDKSNKLGWKQQHQHKKQKESIKKKSRKNLLRNKV